MCSWHANVIKNLCCSATVRFTSMWLKYACWFTQSCLIVHRLWCSIILLWSLNLQLKYGNFVVLMALPGFLKAITVVAQGPCIGTKVYPKVASKHGQMLKGGRREIMDGLLWRCQLFGLSKFQRKQRVSTLGQQKKTKLLDKCSYVDRRG